MTGQPASKTEMRRAKLREKLIDVAEQRIAEGGLHALKARDVAREAGCAVGAIYTHFEDLQALVMAVNGRTFQRIGAAIRGALDTQDAEDPHAQLIVMSHAYLAFAAENTALWRAVFDLDMSSDGPVPEWYMIELAKLFELIALPMNRIFPSKSADALDMTVRGLFSAVHGIVLLGLEKRISAVPMDRIEAMISELLNDVGR
ncbi:TetR/AcrR family transcriptional regulator [Aliishimia ponticola]|uniref:TetR/AcrR family transcriptional regulator n=1 Tax=Aliishimia ponticola TaxID=2499833 RepID=A0A4S4NEV5_9RHOB|nr:TetR/AcrR family transcriptional regulator [Aliishimia ponticola]THH37087.1 TetR/AcrR family transcriptional regulator [Aliishimia ponticola]